MILHNEKRAAVQAAPPPVGGRILESLMIVFVVGREILYSFCGFTFQIVQFGQTTAEGLTLVGIHLGHLPVKLFLTAALGVLLILFLELSTVFPAFLYGDRALFHQNLSGLSGLLHRNSGQTDTSQSDVCQNLTDIFYHNKMPPYNVR